eukprot:gb/GECH01009637.1/.p1 GENE.gb/GECH01009637.1/~~gb/GECH01009637.1/.p1  ORF type:complete len:222 (+),score=-0.28 gb/GECH01009637.1/:1-666(+)
MDESKKKVVLGINPMDLNSFEGQSTHSIFPILVWEGKEQDVLAFTSNLWPKLVQMENHGVCVPVFGITEVWIQIQFFLICDFSALYNIMNFCGDEFCPMFNVLKPNRMECEGIPKKYSVKGTDITIRTLFCPLHAKERITGSLFLMLSRNERRRMNSLEARIKSLPGCKSFQFKLQGNGYREHNYIGAPYLTGRQCDCILNNRETMYQAVEVSDKKKAINL